jgi:hypothetical protein
MSYFFMLDCSVSDTIILSYDTPQKQPETASMEMGLRLFLRCFVRHFNQGFFS